ncbi:DUF6615 family protein [Nocardia sp. JW2]|uniref:DUF6615 family protein n=1 Tax=Nocardia sp. JW2 TaxID=3450738 RepID=UPI003F423E84
MYRAVRDWASWVRANVDEPDVVLRLGNWARWSGRRVADGERLGIRQPEETLTNSLLLDLRRDLPNLQVQMIGRADESTQGADWEWWIEGRTRWFGALIQAKRLSEAGTYSFNYKPEPSKRNPHPARQIDSLIATAKALDIPPLYVLYNNTANRQALSSRDCAQQDILPSGSSGVTVLSAHTAHSLLQIRGNKPVSLADVSDHAVPWSCLASCPAMCRFGRAPRATTGRPHVIFGRGGASSATRLATQLMTSNLWAQFNSRTVAEPPMTVGIHAEPPYYLPSHDGPRFADIHEIDYPYGDPPRYVVALYRGESVLRPG